MMSLKFQTRLTLVFLSLFLAVQVIVTVFFYTTITKNVEQQVSSQLTSSARIFERIMAAQISELKGMASFLARDFSFRRAVAANDKALIRSELANISGRFDADLALVYTTDGRLVTSAIGTPSLTFNQIGGDLQADTIQTAVVAARGKLYKTVIVPVLAPNLIAWVVLGDELDSLSADQIKKFSPIDLDIMYLYEDGGKYQTAASTTHHYDVGSFISGAVQGEQNLVSSFTHDGQQYLCWRMSLGRISPQISSSSNGEVILYFSIEKALKPFFALALTLSGVLIVSLVVLVIGSMMISRGVAKPLQYLASAADRIAKGEYEEVPVPARNDEITKLTDSFNQMVGAIKEREERIVYQAFHDSETGLYNRNYFEKSLRARIEKGGGFCVVMAEVQHVSELRSVLDHAHINTLMSTISDRISQVANVDVYLLTTDAFIFIVDDVEGIDILASLIMNSFMTPFDIADVVIDVSIKMGIATYPTDSHEFMKLMQAASSALDLGRSVSKGFSHFVASTSDTYKQRLSQMSDLRDALKTGEITFAYQPKLDLETGNITSVEALIRWNSSTRGFVPPDDFIPFAEQTGDIKHVSEWALREAVSQCALWCKSGRHIAVAVNLSTSDLMNINLPGQILSLLREYSLPAKLLKLEVTESAIMHDMARALDVLNMLSAMGLSLAIDDYGTGYSSLSYLKRLPVSEIKIDKSFVLKLAENEEDRILVRSTIELGHNLGLRVTAEGVEDQQSMDMLRDYGCDTLQGYYISRPVPAAQLEAFLTERGE